MSTGLRPAWRTAQESFPSIGNLELPVTLDFTNVATINDDLGPEMQQSRIPTIQSVYIDNSLNAASFILTINNFQNITAQPYTQGIYPVMCNGMLRYTALTTPGIKIPVIWSNTAKDLFVWGPVPGVTVVPPLTNTALDIEPSINGDNVLVAAVALKRVNLYRGVFSVVNPALLKFTDGPGGTLLFAAQLTAGGSLTFQPSGIPWIQTSVGNALILNMSAAVNTFGGFGYQQI